MPDFYLQLEGACIFFKIDLIRGYHQIPVGGEDVSKNTVTTSFELVEYIRMPFWLKCAAQSFQRVTDNIFRDLSFVFVYLDDVLVANRSKDEHPYHLREIFERLHKYGLAVNPKKC